MFYKDAQRHYTVPTLILTFPPKSRIKSSVLLYFSPAGEVAAVAAAVAEQSWGKRILTAGISCFSAASRKRMLEIMHFINIGTQ